MHDDYLWDNSGDLDAEGAQMLALQQTLAPLRYEPEPLRMQLVTPQPQTRSALLRWAPPMLAAAAAALLVLGLRSGSSEAPNASVTSAPPMQSQTPVLDPGVPPAKAGPARVSAANLPTNLPEKEDRTEVPALQPPAEVSGASSPAETRTATRADEKPRTRKRTPTDREEPLGTESSQPSGAGLRRMLSSSEIRDGVAPLKSKARACGAKHGLDHEARVKVKMTIVGSTGRVSAAAPLGEWAGTPLGACVAAVITNARFPRFTKESLGAVYPINVGPKKTASDPAEAPPSSVRGRVTIKARACAVAHDVEPGTEVKLSLEVSESGKVDSVLVRPSGGLSKDARRCLKTSIRTMKLGETPGPFTVTFPVTL